MKRDCFLVVYDYGKGGHWAYVVAASMEAVIERYPELEICARPPDWMSPERQRELKERQTYDLEEKPRGLLALILKERRSRLD